MKIYIGSFIEIEGFSSKQERGEFIKAIEQLKQLDAFNKLEVQSNSYQCGMWFSEEDSAVLTVELHQVNSLTILLKEVFKLLKITNNFEDKTELGPLIMTAMKDIQFSIATDIHICSVVEAAITKIADDCFDYTIFNKNIIFSDQEKNKILHRRIEREYLLATNKRLVHKVNLLEQQLKEFKVSVTPAYSRAVLFNQEQHDDVLQQNAQIIQDKIINLEDKKTDFYDNSNLNIAAAKSS